MKVRVFSIGWKKSASVLVALLLVFAFAGCSKKGSAAGKPASITVEIFDRGTDGGKSNPVSNNWTKWIQEKLLKDENIAVTFVPVPRWEEVTALNNLMAAGTPPDVCLTYNAELVANYRDLNGLLNIAPYIDQMLPGLKEFLGPDLALPGREFIRRYEDSATGAVYALPARRMNTAMRNVFIRKDWLDKLGLPLPSTTGEFHRALAAFKEKDPGNVGKNNVIPFTMGSDVFWGSQCITYPFIDPAISTEERWTNIVVDRYFTMPGYKEGARFLNTLFNEGLLDRNFPLYKTEDDLFNNIKSGFVGAYSDNWDRIYRDSDHIMEDLQKNVPGAEMVPVDCMTSSDGIPRRTAYDAAGALIFIPAFCKNPEAALRYINWLSRYDNYHFLQIGPEGVTHDLVDGLPKIKIAAGPWVQNSPQNIDYTIIINGLDMQDPELTIKALANGYSWPAEKIENAYNVAMHNAVPDPVIPVTLSAAGPYVQTLIDKGNVMLTEAVTASPAGFDRVWDDRIKDWLESGAQAVIDERRAKFFQP
ncbi:MAG: extracellular solute-binding protein [Treponema sp.]|jgi:putative aldouronate transport system substrate-binding protein|nr:extracellular solute-binding protein [Treponema sp.]